jgi:hypothetical protein
MVVDHNGAFRACELRGVVGRLSDYGFDVRRALDSEVMRREVSAIPEANCWCTHSCFIQDSSKFSSRVQLFAIPWQWIRQRFEGGREFEPKAVEPFRILEAG